MYDVIFGDGWWDMTGKGIIKGALALLGIGIAILIIFLTRPAGARVITVADDGGADYSTIQDAVDISGNGDTILVFAGIYHEEVTIEKEGLNVIGNGSSESIIVGKGWRNNVVTIDADDVGIEGFGITNGASGIFVEGWFADIRKNALWNNSFGVHFSVCQFGRCEYNTIYNCSSDGIRFSTSHNNTILDCVLRNNEDGIYSFMNWNNDNIISRCQIFDNEEDGISLNGNRNTVENCSISGHVSDWSAGISIDGADNIVENCSIFNNSYGVNVWDHRTMIKDTSIFECGNGVHFGTSCVTTTIKMCNIFSNIYSGVNSSCASNISVDARSNWWGDETGPFHLSLNPDGMGQTVTDPIIFDPWEQSELNNIPKVILTSVNPGMTLSGLVLVEGESWDMDGSVMNVQISVNSGEWQRAEGTESWEYPLDTEDLPEGGCEIRVRAWDGHDYSVIAKVQVTVKNENDDPDELLLVILLFFLIMLLTVLGMVVTRVSGIGTARKRH